MYNDLLLVIIETYRAMGWSDVYNANDIIKIYVFLLVC